MTMLGVTIALAFLAWTLFISGVCLIGIYQIWRFNKTDASKNAQVKADKLPAPLPRVTVIRPVKGLEPFLYECLASTFQQIYPRDRLTVCFCVSERTDPALPLLEQLVADFPDFDAKVFVEDEDSRLYETREDGLDILGPNPKIRNMSRAYREAKTDLIWIVDCNVWIGSSACGEMVNLLCGFHGTSISKRRKFKFVHQLPLSVDVSQGYEQSSWRDRITNAGGLLEEMFLSTSHAKFYTAINAVAVAPCVVGKSNMFRRSHLDALTSTPTSINPDPNAPCGIDHFSFNICEDYMIGDLLWKSSVPPSVTDIARLEDGDAESKDFTWGNHAMLTPASPHNLAIQPTANYSLRTYIDRRVRWLRVRKFTVTLATLVEPGTESFVVTAFATYSIASLFQAVFHIPLFWPLILVLTIGCLLEWSSWDCFVWRTLHHSDPSAGPSFMQSQSRIRPWRRWILGWLGREALAFPIWAWACFGGMSVVWRGRKFSVGMDMRVHEIEGLERERSGGIVRYAEISGGSDTGSGGECGEKKRRD